MKKEYDNEMKLEFMCRSCNEAFARLTVAAFASQLDPTIEELSEIKTSVSEIVTNAIIHAYEERDDVIRVHSYIEDDCITIEVQGKFNYRRFKNIVENYLNTMRLEFIKTKAEIIAEGKDPKNYNR